MKEIPGRSPESENPEEVIDLTEIVPGDNPDELDLGSAGPDSKVLERELKIGEIRPFSSLSESERIIVGQRGYEEPFLRVPGSGKVFLNIGKLGHEHAQFLCDGKDHWSYGLTTGEMRKQHFGCEDSGHKKKLKEFLE